MRSETEIWVKKNEWDGEILCYRINVLYKEDAACTMEGGGLGSQCINAEVIDTHTQVRLLRLIVQSYTLERANCPLVGGAHGWLTEQRFKPLFCGHL